MKCSVSTSHFMIVFEQIKDIRSRYLRTTQAIGVTRYVRKWIITLGPRKSILQVDRFFPVSLDVFSPSL